MAAWMWPKTTSRASPPDVSQSWGILYLQGRDVLLEDRDEKNIGILRDRIGQTWRIGGYWKAQFPNCSVQESRRRRASGRLEPSRVELLFKYGCRPIEDRSALSLHLRRCDPGSGRRTLGPVGGRGSAYHHFVLVRQRTEPGQLLLELVE